MCLYGSNLLVRKLVCFACVCHAMRCDHHLSLSLSMVCFSLEFSKSNYTSLVDRCFIIYFVLSSLYFSILTFYSMSNNRKTKTKTEQNEKRKKWKKFSFLCVTEGRKVFKRKRRSNLKKESDLRVSFSVVHYLRQCRWLHLLNLSTPTPTPPPTTTTSHFKHHLH